MALTKECLTCGKKIRDFYTYCYKCNSKEEEKEKYKLEQVPGAMRYDKHKGKVFQVYILDTDSGHYVGHTDNLERRLKQHQGNRVISTAYKNPKLIWQSECFNSRHSVTGYEATLKAFRDFEKSNFQKITGLIAKPWVFHTGKVRSKEFVFPRITRKTERFIKNNIVIIIGFIIASIIMLSD